MLNTCIVQGKGSWCSKFKANPIMATCHIIRTNCSRPFSRTMSGGAESGFRHVKPEEYRPRLLHFHGDKKGVKVTEIRRNRGLLDNTDVYILDLGLKLYQWNGSGCNMQEKIKVIQLHCVYSVKKNFSRCNVQSDRILYLP